MVSGLNRGCWRIWITIIPRVPLHAFDNYVIINCIISFLSNKRFIEQSLYLNNDTNSSLCLFYFHIRCFYQSLISKVNNIVYSAHSSSNWSNLLMRIGENFTKKKNLSNGIIITGGNIIKITIQWDNNLDQRSQPLVVFLYPPVTSNKSLLNPIDFKVSTFQTVSTPLHHRCTSFQYSLPLPHPVFLITSPPPGVILKRPSIRKRCPYRNTLSS